MLSAEYMYVSGFLVEVLGLNWLCLYILVLVCYDGNNNIIKYS